MFLHLFKVRDGGRWSTVESPNKANKKTFKGEFNVFVLVQGCNPSSLSLNIVNAGAWTKAEKSRIPFLFFQLVYHTEELYT